MTSRASPDSSTRSPGSGRFSKVVLLILVGLIGVAAGAFVGAPGAAERAAMRALSRLENRFGVRVSAGHVDWTWGGRIVASDVTVETAGGERIASVLRVTLDTDVSLGDRRVRLVSATIEGPSVRFVRHRDGSTNVDSILQALARKGGGSLSSSGFSLDLSGAAVSVTELSATLVSGGVKLPFSLAIPEVIELRRGTVVLAAAGSSLPEGSQFPQSSQSSRIKVAFADTSLDPGNSFEVSVELGPEGWLGPSLGALGRVERIALTPQRPVRFWLGERVVGVGGVGVSREGLELFTLQLSVPVDKKSPDGRVSAAATVERLVVGISDLASLLDRQALVALTARLKAALGGQELAGREVLSRVVLHKPVLSFGLDAEGHHSFDDLLVLFRGLASSEAGAGNVDADGVAGPGANNAANAALIDASAVLVSANLNAAERLLARPRKPPAVSTAVPRQSQAPLAAAIATRLRGVADLIDRARGRLDGVARRLEAAGRVVSGFEVIDGEVVLDLVGFEVSLGRIGLTLNQVGAAPVAPVAPVAPGAPGQGQAPTRSSGPTLTVACDNPWGAEPKVDADRMKLTLSGRGDDRQLDLEVHALPLAAFPDLAKRLHLEPTGQIERAELSLSLTSRLEATFRFATRGLAFAHPSVAAEPLKNLAISVSGTLVFDPVTGSLNVSDLVIEASDDPRNGPGIRLTGSLDMASVLTAPILKLDLTLAETPIQTIIDAIPDGFMPMLRGLRIDGSLGWHLVVDVDTTNPSALRIESTPRPRQLQVVSLGDYLDFNALRGTHAYKIRLFDGTPGTRVVGPATASWVSLSNITSHLPLVLTTTEDGTFYSNDGISTFAIRESIATNIERGTFARGASTITQQLVKNLYLGGDKTLSRKIQELFIAWQVAQNLSKDEVMALYLNTIEFGPGIYGIGDAAWHWFGKRPIDLSLSESVFLASIIPGPRRYYTFFEQGHVTPRWAAYVEMLMKVMVDRRKITPDELTASLPVDIRFRGAGGGYHDEAPADFDALPERDDFGDPEERLPDE